MKRTGARAYRIEISNGSSLIYTLSIRIPVTPPPAKVALLTVV